MEFYLEDSQILDATAQNFIDWATWCPGVVHPCNGFEQKWYKDQKKSLLVSRRRSVQKQKHINLNMFMQNARRNNSICILLQWVTMQIFQTSTKESKLHSWLNLSKLNSGNACYHFIHMDLSAHYLRTYRLYRWNLVSHTNRITKNECVWQHVAETMMEAITGNWRTCNEELHNLFSLPNIISVRGQDVWSMWN